MSTPRRLLVLALGVIALAVFPFGWLSSQWPAFAAVFEAVFGSEWGHRLGHAGVFVTVGGALMWAIPPLRRRPGAYAAAILAVGCAQEAIQLTYKARAPGGAEAFDLACDLTAAMTIWALVALRRPERSTLGQTGARR